MTRTDPASGGVRVARAIDLLGLTFQMGLLWLIAKAYSLENSLFHSLFALATVGFVVNAVLPLRFRMPFFLVLSAVGAGLVFGIGQAAWLLGLGTALIALSHLPVPFGLRVFLVLSAGVALAVFRGGWWVAPWSSVIWPILGSMFMFRLIVYMYDMKTQAVPFSPWASLSYFFMFPNLCFPLFPVVDYKNFVRGHYQRDSIKTYQEGMETILRGLVQLLLYRLVYQNISISPGAIENATDAALYLVRPYLLYLKVSGSFHVSVGLLQVFGFALPRTNHNYFLASSFTDYWRRINIYWKEFLQKIFFTPAYMRLNRNLGATTSLICATLIAFMATWVLHSYQWYWIQGRFPVIWQDIVFWSVMGAIVLTNMIYETKYGRRRTIRGFKRTARTDMMLGLKVMGTFTVVFLSWAIWSVRSWSDLELAMHHLLRPGPRDAGWILGSLLTLGIAAVVFDRLDTRKQAATGDKRYGVGILRLPLSAIKVFAVAIALVGSAYGSLVFFYPAQFASFLDAARNPLRLNSVDAQMLDRGYYEDLTDVSRLNPELAQIYARRPLTWERCWALHRTGSFPQSELLPSRTVGFKGAMMSTNQWGMRDREYTKDKPDGVFRVAIMGASHAMGTGVEDNASFENLVEDRLNELAEQGGGPRVEILNFSVPGYGSVSRLHQLEHKVLEFAPDAVVVVAVNDMYWTARDLCLEVAGKYTSPYPDLVAATRALDLPRGMDFDDCMEKMHPDRGPLLEMVYDEFSRLCAERGIQPVLAGISRVREEDDATRADWHAQFNLARQFGFEVFDMTNVYERAASLEDLWLAPWDSHPNAAAHQMLADSFYGHLSAFLKAADPQ